jgi:hypothetical protein
MGMLRHADSDVRWCGVQCLSLALGLSDAVARHLEGSLLGREEAMKCALRWQSEGAALAAEVALAFCASPSGRTEDDTVQEMIDGSPDGSRKRKFAEVPLSIDAAIGHVSVCGLELPVRETSASVSAAGQQRRQRNRFLPTPTADQSLEALAFGLCMDLPILLEGPPGSGKSAIIEHVAELTGNAGGG